MNRHPVCVVTGATSGIGAATARRLHQAGYRLVIHGRQADTLAAIAAELDAAYLAADIAKADTASRLLDLALERFGGCDLVVNNAGVIEVGPIESINIDKVCAMVRINVEAGFRVAYTFARHFKAQGHGDLVNISSVMGTKTRPFAGAYSGTKYAIEALSESLRLELARTAIRVTCIEPGLVETRLQRDWDPPPAESMSVARPLAPEDVAEQVLHVVSQPQGVKIPRLMILPQDHEI